MICKFSEVLVYLGKDSKLTTAELPGLTMLWKQAERAVKRYTRTEIEQATFIEYYPSVELNPVRTTFLDIDAANTMVTARNSQDQIIILRNTPVRSITEVRENSGALCGQAPGAFPDASILQAGTQYWFQTESDGICKTGFVRRRGLWPADAGSVKITYVGGYTPEELDDLVAEIKLATLMTIAHYWNRHVSQKAGLQGGIKTSEHLGDYSYSLGGNFAQTAVKVPAEAGELLDEHTHMSY